VNRELLRRLAAFLVLLVALLGVAEGHEWSAGADAVEESDVALARGEVKEAIVQARRAAEAAVPFSPYPREGYERLESIARGAELHGDLELAAFAWRAVRSASAATRPAVAARGRGAEANEGILRVARSSLSSSFATRGADEIVLQDELASDETPSLWGSFGLTLGAIALAAGLAALARRIRSRAASRLPVA
jgi:hypothetical protein